MKKIVVGSATWAATLGTATTTERLSMNVATRIASLRLPIELITDIFGVASLEYLK